MTLGDVAACIDIMVAPMAENQSFTLALLKPYPIRQRLRFELRSQACRVREAHV